MTGEEKVKQLYDRYAKRELSVPYDKYDPEILQVIQSVITMLGHKIKGINC